MDTVFVAERTQRVRGAATEFDPDNARSRCLVGILVEDERNFDPLAEPVAGDAVGA